MRLKRSPAAGLRRVLDHELHTLLAAPVIGAQMAAEMQHGTGLARLQQGRTELALDAAKSHGTQARPLPVAGRHETAHMLLAHHIGLNDAGSGERETRFGITRTIGTELLQAVAEIGVAAADAKRAVEAQA